MSATPSFAEISLRTRVSALVGLAAVLVLGVAAWVIDWRVDGEMARRFDDALLAHAQALAALTRFERGGLELEGDAQARGTAAADGGERAWFRLRCDGHDVAGDAAAADWPAPGGAPAFADHQRTDGRRVRIAGLRFTPGLGDTWGATPSARADAWRAAGAARLPDCTLQLAQARGGLDQTLDALDAILIGSILLALLAVLLLAPPLVRRGLRPLTALGEAMRGIGPNDPGRRLAPQRTPELAPLVARFNEVLARMDAGLAREREFAAGLAHELRTRLAELRSLAEVEARYPSGRERADLLAEIGAIGAEMEATVAALLLLTRIESGLERAQPRPLPLAAAVERAWARSAAEAEQRGLALSAEGLLRAPDVAADPALFDVALGNLFANAVAYAPPDSVLTLRCTDGALQLGNAAPELEPADLARLGERFWRKREGGGHAGLGLALARAAARAQGWTLAFALENGVLSATLRWPPRL